ncbi:aminotransferase-like domain-containing protein [Dyadobacter luticola]|uniref:PLP-dependent aminotransferase family protein n=1 Tax=Dyadobacter luticola TaxID=1979387 RepID=A0A5R9KWX4_9BACT|nr:PLP-dependent aminotransferase family protein [Dyadobacter luticola]TLV00671.1 PLP-dependent aminotransferase family protein [Dyadobacter luticola]
MYDFRFNYPLSDNHHKLLLKNLKDIGPEINLGMVPVGGLDADRQVASRWLSVPGSEIAAENIFIAGGGHQAMTSILLCAGLAGKVVVADAITYNGLKSVAGMLNVKLAACPTDEEGMLPDALYEICRKTGAKAVYLMPTIHNPLCIVMPLKRRLEIVEVARKLDLILIDDDAYGFLEAQPPLNFARLAPERSFYIYSFAKPLSAGLKTSYIVVPPQWQSRIIEAIRITGSGAPMLLNRLTSQVINSGDAEAIIVEKRAEGALRQQIVADVLAGVPYHTHPNSFHIWIPLPADLNVAHAEARLQSRGVEVVTSLSYQIENDVANNGIRLALGNVHRHADIRDGLEIVAEVLKS